MTYLIDTDWVIDHLRQVETTTRRLEELAPQGLAMSIVSLAELYEGIYYSRDPVQSERLAVAASLEMTLGLDECLNGLGAPPCYGRYIDGLAWWEEREE